MNFLQARLIGERYAAVWSDKIKVSYQWDIFPNLFAEEKKEFEETQKQEQFEDYKEQRRAHAMRHNMQTPIKD